MINFVVKMNINYKKLKTMKEIIIAALAAASGIYVEKKFKVCDKIKEQIEKYILLGTVFSAKGSDQKEA